MPDFDFTGADAELAALRRLVLAEGERRVLARGERFARRGEPCPCLAYVRRGGFKYATPDSLGRERILAFAFEGDFVSAYVPARLGRPALMDIAAVERSVVVQIRLDAHTDFFEHSVGERTYVSRLAEAIAAQHVDRLVRLVGQTPRERYFDLLRRVPDVFSRVSLRDVAAYVGIDPATLSRMRTALLREPRPKP